VITVDTLRADHLSGWGYGRPTSPALDRLAARGTRFRWAFSASSCTASSHASLFTGAMPSFHTVGTYNSLFPLDPGARTLAERLAERGYSTAAVVSNPVLARRLGLDQGFATYDDDMEGHELNRPDRPDQTAEVAVAKARALVAGLEPPFFVWLHLQDPHGPYEPPGDWGPFHGADEEAGPVLPVGDDQSGYGAIPQYQVVGGERRAGRYVDRYDDEIAWFDKRLGGWLDQLAAGGILDRTLVVVTADHGEALGEDGYWFAHGQSVGLDQVHVPLIVAGPGVATGRVVDEPMSNVAIFDTVLALATAGEPEAGPGGSGLVAWLTGEMSAAGSAPPVFVESVGQIGVVAGGLFLRRDRVPADDRAFWSAPNPTTGGFWKPLGTELRALTLTEGDAAAAGQPSETDPGQSAEIEPGQPTEADRARLEELLDGYERRAAQAAAAVARRRSIAEPTDEERARLRALGYAG
jgi:arylsulfatase